MKTMIFDTKGTPAEVMADINEAVMNESFNKVHTPSWVEEEDYSGATTNDR